MFELKAFIQYKAMCFNPKSYPYYVEKTIVLKTSRYDISKSILHGTRDKRRINTEDMTTETGV